MIDRYGAKGTVTEGVFFTEKNIPDGRVVQKISVEISRQNSDLTQIKQKMAKQAVAAGATAIANFRYGQRRHRGIKLLLPKWDTESWFGEGDAVTGLSD